MSCCKDTLGTEGLCAMQDAPADLCARDPQSLQACEPGCCRDGIPADEVRTAAFASEIIAAVLADHDVSVDSIPVPESILAEADRIVNGPRRESYGHPAVNFARIAHLWNGYLAALVEDSKIEGFQFPQLLAQDVCQMMIHLKQCRLIQNRDDRDGHVDIAGYAQCSKLISECDK